MPEILPLLFLLISGNGKGIVLPQFAEIKKKPSPKRNRFSKSESAKMRILTEKNHWPHCSPSDTRERYFEASGFAENENFSKERNFTIDIPAMVLNLLKGKHPWEREENKFLNFTFVSKGRERFPLQVYIFLYVPTIYIFSHSALEQTV